VIATRRSTAGTGFDFEDRVAGWRQCLYLRGERFESFLPARLWSPGNARRSGAVFHGHKRSALLRQGDKKRRQGNRRSSAVREGAIRTEKHPKSRVVIWVVVADDEVFVRSWRGTKGRWYRDIAAAGPQRWSLPAARYQ
jgi:hypothetical protein